MHQQANEPDQTAIDAVNLSRIRTAQDTHASETGALRSVFARAEAQGLNLSAAKRAIKIIKTGKADEWLQETAKITEYLSLLGKPIETEQFDLFTGRTKSAPEDERAQGEGLAAGRGGADEHQNPYDPGSPKGQAWLKAFRVGRDERDAVLAMKEPEVDADEDGDGDE